MDNYLVVLWSFGSASFGDKQLSAGDKVLAEFLN